jgi:hypothetical protein
LYCSQQKEGVVYGDISYVFLIKKTNKRITIVIYVHNETIEVLEKTGRLEEKKDDETLKVIC